jgi:hypothetical protein
MVPAVPTAGFPASWPTDGRAGGVPDPTTAGPDIVQIGSEGGLLPAVAVHKSQPITYDLDKRSITILNVLHHSLQLGGAERADVLIDFSKYAGQTLLVYNDAPTPMPAVDPRTDLYTGMGDKTDSGGAYDPLPGYGPNTRTIMQIKVNATNTSGTGGALDVNALKAALPVAYAKTQAAPIVPQVAYNAPFGTKNVDNYAQIRTGGNSMPYFLMSGTTFGVTGISIANGGSGYSNLPGDANYPVITFSAPQTAAGTKATADPVVSATGVLTGITNFQAGTGYTNTSPITVSISRPLTGTTASAIVTTNAFKVINKAIQELFDPVFGRMNATLAVELPFSSALVATTIPLAYVDTPIDSIDGIKDGETQIWKITHNGVDSHPVHFHLVNVQLINRVDWAGVVKPPAPEELGWKETVVMNPLEDVYVAAKAVRPVTPFGLPSSQRLLDPSQAVGSTIGFTQIDPVTGQAPTFQRQLVNGGSTDVTAANYSNQLTDFDNEYVWHCHILGHEENDFMRPFIFHPTVLRPDAPTNVAVNGGVLSWTDPTPFGGVDKDGVPTAGTTAGLPGATYSVEPTNNPKNEIGFKVIRTEVTTVTTTTPAAVATDPAVVTVTTSNGAPTVALVPANMTSWTDTTVLPPATSTPADALGVTTDTTYSAAYGVKAYNMAGESNGSSVVQTVPDAAPTLPTSVIPVAGQAAPPTGLVQTGTSLSWNTVAGATAYVVTVGGVSQTVTNTTVALNGTAGTVTVAAVVDGTTGQAASAFNGNAYSPVAVTATTQRITTGTNGSAVTLTWANNPLNVNNVKTLTLTWGQGNSAGSSQTFVAGSTGATIIGLTADKDYTFRLVANGMIGDSAAVTLRILTAK